MAQHYLEMAAMVDEANPLLAKLRSQIVKAQQKNNSSSLLRFDHAWPRPDLMRKKS